MPNTLGLTRLSAMTKLEENNGAIAHHSTPGYKRAANPEQILKQLRAASMNARTASRLLEQSFNEIRHTLDRIHFLLYLCNTQKAITAPPR